ncbi:putative modified peptide [Duganella sp. FT92W]|uniref:Putative modified peptide n=1 Tax=Pseudoduganella rivuli TaxID=2666085 RepID=A0A7X2LV86_9BURK|nr:NHLP-related RiPP peptide [Pseudoduganella rivuli]MRV73664.1 putative modified peptide [Pseudoduganella rivuli]
METVMNRDLDKILDKLSRDDAFRAWVADDPIAAMASIGVAIDAQQLPGKVVLPSKEVMMSARLAIRAKLDSAAGAIPFFLSGKL